MPSGLSDEKARSLRGILQREGRSGYLDSTLSSGLDGVLTAWWRQGQRFPLPSPSYRHMTVAQRQSWATGLLAWLGSDPEPGADGGGEDPDVGPPAAGHSAEPAPPRRIPGRTGGARRPPPLDTPPAPLAALTLDSPITALPRMRAPVAVRLKKLGVETIRDALFFFPRRHLDFTRTVPIAAAQPGTEVTVTGVVWSAAERSMGPRMKSAVATIGDRTGTIRAVWFNQPYLAKQFRTGTRIALSGRVSVYQGQLQLESPLYEVSPAMSPEGAEGEGLDGQGGTHTGRLVPIYSLTEGLSDRTVRQLVRTVVDGWADRAPEPLPADLQQRFRFPPIAQALRQAHYPDSLRDLARARRRLAFDELLAIQLWMLQKRLQWQGLPALPVPAAQRVLSGFHDVLPFTFTAAQQRALAEILQDMDSEVPMLRLLQGDVGSGKTVVAASALLLAAAAGHQAAIMAPTEVLAEQHYRALCRVFGAVPDGPLAQSNPPYLDRPLRIGLLSGSLSPKLKAGLQQAAAAHEVDILAGTHALIQERVQFADLPLAVIDEQHRFGTAQRQALRQKGINPHVLVMTATPVPRSLALTVYGDLEVSVIDEMPAGRRPIETRVVEPASREAAEQFVRQQVRNGRQAYVICPLIDESERVQARAATAEYERLATEVFPDLQLDLLHGRMPSAGKEAVMDRFRSGRTDILISTTVIEVGIDVPNASVMLIEGADRFGLSQLHQLRGRVGRGAHQSYCLLLLDGLEEVAATAAGPLSAGRPEGGLFAGSHPAEGGGSQAIDALSDSLPVTSAAEFHRGDILALGDERLLVTAVHQREDRLTVRRGYRDTTPVPHRHGEPITRYPERLAIMERVTDGFRLAEEDFRLRGPGELAGTRQSGLSELRMARLPRDRRLLESARAVARQVLRDDPELAGPFQAMGDLITRLNPSEAADVS